MADRIHEIRPVHGQIAAVSEQSNRALDTVYDRVSRLEAQISALLLDSRHRPGSRSRRRRSRSRERLQQPGICNYHRTFRDRANKCRFPCSWNQGNANSTYTVHRTMYAGVHSVVTRLASIVVRWGGQLLQVPVELRRCPVSHFLTFEQQSHSRAVRIGQSFNEFTFELLISSRRRRILAVYPRLDINIDHRGSRRGR